MKQRLAIAAALCVTTSCAGRSSHGRSNTPDFRAASSAIMGAWEPVDITLAPNAIAHAGDQAGPAGPGLWIFTARHYAVLDVHTTEPRKPVPNSNPTVEDLMATWGRFGANAGTYETTDSVLTTHPSVAMNPQVMAPGRSATLSFRIQGDTMWMWSTGGPLGHGETIKYRRVE